MDNKTEHDALTRAIGEFSIPYETLDEAKTVSIKIDAIVSALIRTSFAERRVGPKRLKELSSGTAEAPGILRVIGGESFERVAQLAETLIEIGRASVLDIGGSGNDEILKAANASRQSFSEAFKDFLPLILGY